MLGCLSSYMPHQHGRIDNNKADLKRFLIEQMCGKDNWSLRLDRTGLVRLVKSPKGSVNVEIQAGKSFLMHEAETLELFQGVFTKLILNMEDKQPQLHNYFKDKALHSMLSSSYTEKEFEIGRLARKLDQMTTENRSLKAELKEQAIHFEENYKLIFTEIEKLQEQNQRLTRSAHSKQPIVAPEANVLLPPNTYKFDQRKIRQGSQGVPNSNEIEQLQLERRVSKLLDESSSGRFQQSTQIQKSMTSVKGLKANMKYFLTLSSEGKRQILGELLYPLVKAISGDSYASKVTGMLIDLSVLEVSEVLEMIENNELLEERVEEAIELIIEMV